MRLRDKMPELDGATKWFNCTAIKRSELIGDKPALFHFWSVSCELCKKSMPKVNVLRDEYKNKLNVIAVHVPRSDMDLNLDKISKVAREYDISHPICVDNKQNLVEAFKNKYVPAYYVFDKKGRLRHRHSGGSGMIMLRKRVTRLLD